MVKSISTYSVNGDQKMNNTLNNTENILDTKISGFHQYILEKPFRLSFVSKNLCNMLGKDISELQSDKHDLYALCVHPADQEKYTDFLQRISVKEQTLSTEYRLIKKDGSVIFVKDCFTTEISESGTMIGSSVLTDITDIKNENNDLRFLNETIPCGFMKYTCEKQPRVTYINKKMIDILRFPEVKDGEMDYLELYKSNIFLMIPMEERRRFSKYLNRVYSSDVPIAGEITLLRCDGTRAHIFGWVTKTINEHGKAEFQTVCMDVTDRHQKRKNTETQRYLKALTDVYDKIFEFNIDSNTVKCLHSNGSPKFKHFEDIAIQIEDAYDKWIRETVVPEDRERVLAFFRDFCQKKLTTQNNQPPMIEYTAQSSSGENRKYKGVFIKVDDSVSFYCCRTMPNTVDANVLMTENSILRENMKELVMRFTDGLAAFEVTADGLVKPLFANDNVCEFFDYTKDEWITLMEKSTPLENFVAYSDTAYEDFAELLRNGEAEFTYFDCKSEKERKIKAICSHKEANVMNSRYVMLYYAESTDQKQKENLPENRTVSIRTFGYFDVFVGDIPIAFRNKKAKELFALLVDRKGGYVSSEEAIGFLWEDEPTSTVTLSRYRKVALRLKNTLEEYGISDIIETVDGKRRVIPEKVQCDLYNYLSGKEEYSQLFKGSYLTNYSWAETTLGELSNRDLI